MFKPGDRVRRKNCYNSNDSEWKSKCRELGLDRKGVFAVTGTWGEKGLFLENFETYSFSSNRFKKVEEVNNV